MFLTKSKYNGLSYALCKVIPIIELLKEMKLFGFRIAGTTSKVHCRLFKDNSGALETAKFHKLCTQTKHINVKMHNFRDYVTRKEISIHRIRTTEQPAYFLTKPLNDKLLIKNCITAMGW